MIQSGSQKHFRAFQTNRFDLFYLLKFEWRTLYTFISNVWFLKFRLKFVGETDIKYIEFNLRIYENISLSYQDLKNQGDLRSSLASLEGTPLWHVAQWVSRAPPHRSLPAFLNLNDITLLNFNYSLKHFLLISKHFESCLGPRLFTSCFGWGSFPFQAGNENYNYHFWIPIIGPIIGAQLGAFMYKFGIEVMVWNESR